MADMDVEQVKKEADGFIREPSGNFNRSAIWNSLKRSIAAIEQLQAEITDLKTRLSEVMKERDEAVCLTERMRLENEELRSRLEKERS